MVMLLTGLLLPGASASAMSLESVAVTMGMEADATIRSEEVLWAGPAVSLGWNPWRLGYSYQYGFFDDGLEANQVFLGGGRPNLARDRHVLTLQWQTWWDHLGVDLGGGWGWTRLDRMVVERDSRLVYWLQGVDGSFEMANANLQWFHLDHKRGSDPVVRAGLGIGFPRWWVLGLHLEQCGDLSYGASLDFRIR